MSSKFNLSWLESEFKEMNKRFFDNFLDLNLITIQVRELSSKAGQFIYDGTLSNTCIALGSHKIQLKSDKSKLLVVYRNICENFSHRDLIP